MRPINLVQGRDELATGIDPKLLIDRTQLVAYGDLALSQPLGYVSVMQPFRGEECTFALASRQLVKLVRQVQSSMRRMIFLESNEKSSL